ncbi:MAG: hypothetical protein J5848_04515 [Bacteroidales bacterium]|nr:hypothetical protein [Bacteroidales bacterium]
MKKLVLTIMAVMLGAGAFAQVDSVALQREQEALRQQQQREQQDLLERQQREQERALQEQERALQQQQREQERALQQQQREQERQQAELLKQQERQVRREQRRAEIGRDYRISINPFIGIATPMTAALADAYNSNNMMLGLELEYHYPLSKGWDFNIALGYRIDMLFYINSVQYDNNASELVFNYGVTALNNKPNLFVHSFDVPLRLSHVNESGREWYFGLTPGLNFANQFRYLQLYSDGDYRATEGLTYKSLACVSGARLDFVFGWRAKRFLFFNPGWRLFFNILPTYNVTGHKYHEIGVTIEL